MGQSRFKSFEDHNIIASQKLKFDLGMAEDIVGKGENAGYHFLLFVKKFSYGYFYRMVRFWNFVVKG